MDKFRADCDESIKYFEEELKPQDKRFSTPEATWNIFVAALKSGDKKTLIESLSGEAHIRLEPQLLKRPVAELRKVGELYTGIQIWADEYADELGQQEATSIKFDGRKGMLFLIK